MASTPLSYDFSKEHSKMTCDELRASIAHKTGHKPPNAQIGKRITNSIHAYLTGEFAVPPAALHRTRSSDVRMQTYTVVINHDEFPLDVQDDDVELLRWVGDREQAQRRALTRDALLEVVTTMDRAEDAREWTQ